MKEPINILETTNNLKGAQSSSFMLIHTYAIKRKHTCFQRSITKTNVIEAQNVNNITTERFEIIKSFLTSPRFLGFAVRSQA